MTIAGQTFSVTQAGQTPANTMRVGSSAAYPTIQSGYNAAVTGDTIQVQTGTYPENDNFNINIPVSLVGGYNNSFSTSSSYSVITGTLTISNGAVTAQNIIIQ